MEQTKSVIYIKRAGIVLALLLLGLGVFNLYQHAHFRIVSTDPVTNQVTTLTPFFKLVFNKPLSASSVLISTNPQIIYQPLKVSGDTVTIYLSVPLDPAKTYSVTLQNVTAKSGQHITNKRFIFRPAVVSHDKLPEDQQEALILRNEQSIVYKDPILPHLPYHSVDFNLTSLFGSTANNQPLLTLQAQLLIHAAQAGDTNAALDQDKQEVQNYILSFGLNPNNYTIKYSIIAP